MGKNSQRSGQNGNVKGRQAKLARVFQLWQVHVQACMES
jgi:hypothetical protein